MTRDLVDRFTGHLARLRVAGQPTGHADSKMTLDVYAQLAQWADRTHGTSFDALLTRAGGQRGDR